MMHDGGGWDFSAGVIEEEPDSRFPSRLYTFSGKADQSPVSVRRCHRVIGEVPALRLIQPSPPARMPSQPYVRSPIIARRRP